MLSSFQELVEKIRIEAEKKIKAELSKRSRLELFGFRLFMPLTVNIVTDRSVKSVCAQNFYPTTASLLYSLPYSLRQTKTDRTS
jgi:hypothetical protein